MQSNKAHRRLSSLHHLRHSLSCNGVSFEMHHNVITLFNADNINNASSTFFTRFAKVLPDNKVAPLPEIDGLSSRDVSSVVTIPIPLPPPSADDTLDARKLRASPISKRQQRQREQKARLGVILLQQSWLTVYKRLFAIVFTINIFGLSLAASGHFPYGKSRAALVSVINILLVVLCRNEVFLRFVFWLAVKLFGHKTWVPLPVKTAVTSFLQSLGGIHSGCGVSSVIWLIYAIVQGFIHHHTTPNAVIAVAFGVLVLLLASCLGAIPVVRHLHHNVFERVHRFAGWTALALVWVFIILSDNYNPLTRSYSVHGHHLVTRLEFWFTAMITFLIILPWLCVRRVSVQAVIPSDSVSILKFSGAIQPGLLGRISRSPLSEWHAFGIISDGKEEHMMLAGAVGDFTNNLVANPPTHLWVRTFRFAGLPYLVNMYNKVMLVATGSGICVFLSFLLQPTRADVYLIWIAKAIEKTYGRQICDMLANYPSEKRIVYDTALSGRPNVKKLVVDAAHDWGAEAVIVTSNPSGSKDVVDACEAASIPAFGPIWDS